MKAGDLMRSSPAVSAARAAAARIWPRAAAATWRRCPGAQGGAGVGGEQLGAEMALIVQKFGGTSVGSIERIEQVADKVARFRDEGHDVVVVVSAMSGETNRLIALAHEVQEHPVPREMDALCPPVSRSPPRCWRWRCTSAASRPKATTAARCVSSPTMRTPRRGSARSTTERLRAGPRRGKRRGGGRIPGRGRAGNITTLGRGGSDTTAVALAAALKADECQIYTDVDGVYTTDPRIVDGARRLDKITFEEMLEMASMGSKVLQIRAVEFAGKYNVPLRVLHSFKDGPGTLITLEEDDAMETPTIAGIAFNRDEAKLTILGVPDMPGVAYRILGPIGEANIEVDVIVQNVAEDNTTDFTFTVGRGDLARAEDCCAYGRGTRGREVRVDSKIAKVSVVGVGMRSHAGVASQMFEALAEVGINIQMITTSEIKISVIIEENSWNWRCAPCTRIRAGCGTHGRERCLRRLSDRPQGREA
jgi:aspartate kinase